MSKETHEALNQALVDHLAEEYKDDPMLVTHWTMAIAGYSVSTNEPHIASEHSSTDMPSWQVRGLLNESLAVLNLPERK